MGIYDPPDPPDPIEEDFTSECRNCGSRFPADEVSPDGFCSDRCEIAFLRGSIDELIDERESTESRLAIAAEALEWIAALKPGYVVTAREALARISQKE